MVASTLVKLSSPVAKSCLFTISAALLIDSVLLIYASSQYPYLIDYFNNELYIEKSHTIMVVYSSISAVSILLSLSTAIASYKHATNYVLIHAGITGVFLPVLILVYFSAASSRYKVSEYVDDYKQMIADYRISGSHMKRDIQIGEDHVSKTTGVDVTSEPKKTLKSFINVIDSLQSRFSCCGVDSVQDWIKRWDGYIPPTCCRDPLVSTNPIWADMFHVDKDYEFKHCNETQSFHLGCLVSLKEDEISKYAWLGDLIVFMIVITIANTIVSLLLFGLSNTEDTVYEGNKHELSIVGVSSQPRLSQPTITSIKHRPSVVHNLGVSKESLNARAQAVRFNISRSPRTSITGASKFSPAARRGSSFL